MTKRGVDDSIAALPENVNQAYERILSKSQNSQMVRKVLSIVLVANQPLMLAEMNIAVDIDTSTRNTSDLDLEEKEYFQASLRRLRGLFVSVHHSTVYFLY